MGYNVYRDGLRIDSAPIATMGYNDSHLNGSTAYNYTVSALSFIGVESAQSAVLVGKTNSSWVCEQWTATNEEHVMADRAYVCNDAFACCRGSNNDLGTLPATTTVSETSEGYFKKGACKATARGGELPSWPM